MANGLDLFKEVVSDFRGVTGLIAKGAIAAPLADYVIKLGPPWPGAAPIMTALLELLVLIGAFEFWYATSRKKQRRRMLIFIASSLAFFFLYFFLTSQYTFKHPVSGDMMVLGYDLHPDAEAAMQPGDDVGDLLEGAEYRPEEVWTSQSLAFSRLGLLVSWFGLFASIAGFIAVFVMIQRRIQIQPPRANKPRRAGRRKPSGTAPTTAPHPHVEATMSDDSPSSAAERIRNHGERLRNAGDTAGERAARDAADRAERATPERAREIERDFNRGNDRPSGPNRGPGT